MGERDPIVPAYKARRQKLQQDAALLDVQRKLLEILTRWNVDGLPEARECSVGMVFAEQSAALSDASAIAAARAAPCSSRSPAVGETSSLAAAPGTHPMPGCSA